MAQVRAKNAATQAQHLRLVEMLIRIDRRQVVIDVVRFETPLYWHYVATGGREGPYCPQCWDTPRNAIPLCMIPFRGHDRWVCRPC